MACQEDFHGDEAIGEDIWDREVDDLIRQSEAEPPKYGFKCEKCEKMSSQNKVSLDIEIRKTEKSN